VSRIYLRPFSPLSPHQPALTSLPPPQVDLADLLSSSPTLASHQAKFNVPTMGLETTDAHGRTPLISASHEGRAVDVQVTSMSPMLRRIVCREPCFHQQRPWRPFWKLKRK
jgi:hypothetical protein